MLKNKAKRGSTFIAVLAVVAALVGGPAAGAAAGFFNPDASWAEGA